jgi:hypothetical protein
MNHECDADATPMAYKCTALDLPATQIRVLSLTPGIFEDSIAISLSAVDLDPDDPP